MAIPQFPQNPNARPVRTGTPARPANNKPVARPANKSVTPQTGSYKKPIQTRKNNSLFSAKTLKTDNTANYEQRKEAVKRGVYAAAGSAARKSAAKVQSPGFIQQAVDFVSDWKTKYDNSVRGEGFRNLNGNSTVDALYQAKDLTDDIDSFVNRSHGGRKALAKFDRKMNSTRFADTYNKLRAPASNAYHTIKGKVSHIKGRFKSPVKYIQGKITSGTKWVTGKAKSGCKVVKGFFRSKSAAAFNGATAGTRSLSMLDKMKNLNLVKRTGKLLNKCNDFVQLVSSGAKTSSKWVKGVRFVSSSAKVAGRACWVAAIGINCYEVYDAFKKGGVKAAAPKALQCATETACAWAGAKAGAAIGLAFGPVGAAIGGIAGGLAGYFIGSKAGKYVVKAAKAVYNAGKKAVKFLGNGVKKLWNGGKKLVGKAIDTGKKFVKGVVDTGKKVINKAKNFGKKVWNAIKFW